MIIQILFTIIGIIIFELISKEINFLVYLNSYFIIINLLYWFRRYRLAVFCGVIAGFLIDLIFQNPFGKSVLSLFIPLLITTVFDNIIQVDSRINRISFSVISTVFGIFISEILFDLFFIHEELVIITTLKSLFYSGILVFLLYILLERFFLLKEDISPFRR